MFGRLARFLLRLGNQFVLHRLGQLINQLLQLFDLRLNLEALDEGEMERRRDEVLDLIRS